MPQKKIADFFAAGAEKSARLSAQTIANDIVEDLITSVVDKKTKCQRHTGGKHVQTSTEKSWLSQYPWLEIRCTQSESHVTKVLLCKTCTAHSKTNIMATSGSPNIQSSTIKSHELSHEHKDAVRLEMNLKRKNSNTIEIDLSEFESGCVTEADKIVFRTVYFCAKEELPSETINKLLKYDIANGLKPGMQDLSWTTINEMQQVISDNILKKIVHDVKLSNFCGIMIDESCDLSVEKKLVVCIRYIVDGETTTSYLGSVDVEDGKAHTITRAVTDMLHSFDIDMTQVTGLSTDGAATMVGRKMGVGVQLKSKCSPYMTQVHCMAHRLALGCVDAVKGLKPLETFKTMFNTLYFHFSSSAVRTAKLKAIQDLFQDKHLQIKEPHAVRWLSLKKAVEAVYNCYPSVVSTLADLASTNSTAKALYKYFNSKKTALLCSLMLDIHTEIAIMSCELQKEELLFSEVGPMLEATLAGLEQLKTGGKFFNNMKRELELDDGLKGVQLSGDLQFAKDSVLVLMNNYIGRLQENITDRLTKQDGDIISNIGSVLQPETFDESLADGAIEDLGAFYGTPTVTKLTQDDGTIAETPVEPLLDRDGLIHEWPRFKAMLKGSYKKDKLKTVCKKIIMLHMDRFPNMAILCKIALCICVTSVKCETSFSTQNRIKTKFRCSLKQEKLDILQRIAIEGQPFCSFDPSHPARVWRALKKRRDKRLCLPYTPRNNP